MQFRSLCATTSIVLTAVIALASGCAVSEQRLYAQSIKDASVRGPGWDTPLWPLPKGSMSVSTFTDETVLDLHSPLYVWVAATAEVWQLCHGRHDSVLTLEQVLGLPPLEQPKSGNRWHFFVFDIDSHDLIRPCPGGVDAHDPARPRCRLDSDVDPQLDPELMQFLVQQWWSAHRATVEQDRDPELGYPWTGMGWTYNWDPRSTSHRGVSEFIVRKSAVVANLRSLSPADFCKAASPPLR